jgi:hypothetical protein
VAHSRFQRAIKGFEVLYKEGVEALNRWFPQQDMSKWKRERTVSPEDYVSDDDEPPPCLAENRPFRVPVEGIRSWNQWGPGPSEEDLIVEEWEERERTARQLLDERKNLLREALLADDKGASLERFLRDVKPIDAERDDLRDFTLDMPILELLVRKNSAAIPRAKSWCPHSECEFQEKESTRLSTHLETTHGEEANDLVSYDINQLLDGKLRVVIICTETGVRLYCPWLSERCRCGDCKYITDTHRSYQAHLGRHDQANKKRGLPGDMVKNIRELGEFWGAMKSLIQANPEATIERALGVGPAYLCGISSCRRAFATEGDLRRHFGLRHTDLNVQNSVTPKFRVKQFWEIVSREMADVHQEEAVAMPVQDESQINEEVEEPAQRPQIILTAEERERRRQEFRQKREQHLRELDMGVNIPRLNKAQMKRVKEGLEALFRNEIMPILEECTPVGNEIEEWEAFEGAYEESLHLIRLHITTALQKDPGRIYGRKQINPKTMLIRERQQNAMATHQQVKNIMKKLKAQLEEFGENMEGEDSAEMERRQTALTKRVEEVYGLIDEETKLKVFGSADPREIWGAMNTSLDHRSRVIEWLDSMIETHLSHLLEGMSAKFHEQRVQECYRASKSIAMRRYVNTKESPTCPIDPVAITRHYEDVWAPPPEGFQPAEEDSVFFLNQRIPKEGSDEMMEYLTKDENIKAIIKSRSDENACGMDGIGNQIFKAAKGEGVKFIKKILETSIRQGKMITSWKQAKTILIYKKGSTEQIQNWRPISITNCIYRIFTCLLAKAIQGLNSRYHIFNDSQKGFIEKTNGCSEHAILLNELLNHANRQRKDLVTTAIDFTNAFGSVPHEMILSVMHQRGFPEWLCRLVKEMYTGASSVIEGRGTRTEHIAWKRGVKQGCPLSPILFNLCLEPFIEAIHRKHEGQGVKVETGDKEVEVKIQAYADDIILVSSESDSIQSMLGTLEEFTHWSRMEVNTSKCAMASYLLDSSHHRCSLRDNLTFGGNEIPNLTMGQSLKYLGTAVAARRSVKLESVRAKFEEARQLLRRIEESKLLTVQKIDAIKTFVIPSFDFVLLNGDIGLTELDKMDGRIRGSIDRLLKIPGLPIDFHHASWRDGGLSYPSLADRQAVLRIRSFSQMLTSRDEKVRALMRKFVEEERVYRKVPVDEHGTFLNWKDKEGERGTASLIARARWTCEQRGISIKLSEQENTLKIGINGHLEKPTKADQIGRLLTQNLIRVQRYQNLIEKQVHGATFETLADNTVSNKMMTNIFAKNSDAFFRFVIAARTDNLPTPANIQRWYQTEGATCWKCDYGGVPTLAHILNACSSVLTKTTVRHNALATLVKRAIVEQLGDKIVDGIRENVTLRSEELSPECSSQRPDLSFVRAINETQIIELVEITCPYGKINQPDEHGYRVNTMVDRFNSKHTKYAQLANELQAITGMPVRVTVIVVSSVGAVYRDSLKELGKLLECSKPVLRKLGKKMSQTVIRG